MCSFRCKREAYYAWKYLTPSSLLMLRKGTVSAGKLHNDEWVAIKMMSVNRCLNPCIDVARRWKKWRCRRCRQMESGRERKVRFEERRLDPDLVAQRWMCHRRKVDGVIGET